MFIPSGNDDREEELPREEAEAEREVLAEMEATEVRHPYGVEATLKGSTAWETTWERVCETELAGLEVEATELLGAKVKATEGGWAHNEGATAGEQLVGTRSSQNREIAIAICPNAPGAYARPSTSGEIDTLVGGEISAVKPESGAATEP